MWNHLPLPTTVGALAATLAVTLAVPTLNMAAAVHISSAGEALFFFPKELNFSLSRNWAAVSAGLPGATVCNSELPQFRPGTLFWFCSTATDEW